MKFEVGSYVFVSPRFACHPYTGFAAGRPYQIVKLGPHPEEVWLDIRSATSRGGVPILHINKKHLAPTKDGFLID